MLTQFFKYVAPRRRDGCGAANRHIRDRDCGIDFWFWFWF
jgi:hypothetical protein